MNSIHRTVSYLALIGIIVLAGCASTDTLKQSEGQGRRQSFSQPYDKVYNASVEAAKKYKLDVVEADRTQGKLILSHGVSLGSVGEKIGIFITKKTEEITTVEIVSKPVLNKLSLAPAWPSLLFGEIDARLTTKP